jgi:hypothetical protein
VTGVRIVEPEEGQGSDPHIYFLQEEAGLEEQYGVVEVAGNLPIVVLGVFVTEAGRAVVQRWAR